ncbi:heat-inducible transcriptional repressor HrcA [soil metagenome]
MTVMPPKSILDDRLQGLAQLDRRSQDIFRRLVETYLDTGEPVGSRTISRILPSTLSPASVRNVMMDLEESGLISAPHTSAGRVPTHAGLRLFVDALLEVGSISPEERQRIDTQMAATNRPRRLEDMLGEATTMLSGLSHCAGVVVAPKLNARLKHIEFVSLGPERALVILVAEDGTVENRAIDVPAGLPPSTLVSASNYLSARLQGKTIAEFQRSMREELASLRGELDELAARVIEAGVATWSGSETTDERTLIVRGQANLIENMTAFDDLERIRKLFDDIENKKELVQLLGLAEGGEGVRIFIGSENKLFSLSGSSLIIAPYRNSEEKIVGVLGIIGPTRLNYARIIPMVDYTARVIGRLIS